MGEDRSVLARRAQPDTTRSYGVAPAQVVDVWFGTSDRSTSARPLVVLVHGGFWRPDYDRKHVGPMAAALRDAGWTVMAIEYRREPGNPDPTLDDVRAAVRAAPDLLNDATGPDARRTDLWVVMVGHSAGGHLALWAAAAAPPPRLRATVALAPVADLPMAHDLNLGDGAVAAFLGELPEGRGDLDPVRLPTPATPVVIVHGTDDAVVPPAVSESYATAHRRTRLVRLPNTGHFALIDPRSAAWPAVLGEIARWG